MSLDTQVRAALAALLEAVSSSSTVRSGDFFHERLAAKKSLAGASTPDRDAEDAARWLKVKSTARLQGSANGYSSFLKAVDTLRQPGIRPAEVLADLLDAIESSSNVKRGDFILERKAAKAALKSYAPTKKIEEDADRWHIVEKTPSLQGSLAGFSTFRQAVDHALQQLSEAEYTLLRSLTDNPGQLTTKFEGRTERDCVGSLSPGRDVLERLIRKGLVFETEEDGDWTPSVYIDFDKEEVVRDMLREYEKPSR